MPPIEKIEMYRDFKDGSITLVPFFEDTFIPGTYFAGVSVSLEPEKFSTVGLSVVRELFSDIGRGPRDSREAAPRTTARKYATFLKKNSAASICRVDVDLAEVTPLRAEKGHLVEAGSDRLAIKLTTDPKTFAEAMAQVWTLGGTKE